MNARYILLICLFFIIGCTKNEPVVVEEKDDPISFELEPNPGSSVASTLSSDYTFKVKMLSKLPDLGIKTVLEVIRESDGTSIDISSYDYNATTFDLKVSNLLNGTLYTIKVNVISKKSSNNFLQKTFKVARK